MLRLTKKIYRVFANIFSRIYMSLRYAFSVQPFSVVTNTVITIEDILTIYKDRIDCIDPKITNENFPFIPAKRQPRINGKVVRLGQPVRAPDVCSIFKANNMRPIELCEMLFLLILCKKLLRKGRMVALGSVYNDPDFGPMVPVARLHGKKIQVRLGLRDLIWEQDTQFAGVLEDDEQ